jgi:hypothetical protein
MALTITLSPKEMERVAAAAYQGNRVRVSLANQTSTSYTENSLVTDWDSIKVSGGGYTDFTAVLATGAYDATDTRYEMGATAGANTYVEALFAGTGAGFVFNRVYVVIGTPNGGGGYTDALYLHSLLTESPSITIPAGTSIKYRVQLAIDN